MTNRVRFLFVCLAVASAPFARAQDAPLVGQPTANFYGAQGSGVRVAWALDRVAVPLDEEIVATLVVTNVTNPRKVTRPDLKRLPDYADRFIITDVASAPPAESAKEVKFTYRLRPRNNKVADIEPLAFHYYNPSAAAGKQFPLTKTAKVSITVLPPKPKPKPPPVPLNEPEHLFAIATGPGVLSGAPFAPDVWECVAVAVAVPLLAVAWFAAWRRMFPDAARLARMRRSRAARRAIEGIRRAGRHPDPGAAVAGAVLGYLRARFPLPPAAVTPSEVGAALAELGLPAPECTAVADFFRACDAARFSEGSDSSTSLATAAEPLVTRLEAA